MNTRNPTILLVDDEEKFIDSLAERARLKGFEPFPTRTGQEAIRIVKREKIDIAIVDHKMPGMDGLTTITKLKEIHPGIKTVLLTGFGDEKIKEAAEALDSVYLEKDEMRDLWDFIRQFESHNGMIIINPSLRPNGDGGAREDRLFGHVAVVWAVWGSLSHTSDLTLDSELAGRSGRRIAHYRAWNKAAARRHIKDMPVRGAWHPGDQTLAVMERQMRHLYQVDG